MDWLEIPEFFEIDLAESYVLGWSIFKDNIEFKLEVVLCPGHPEYKKPVSDWTCYRNGSLAFRGVKSLEGLPNQSEVRPSTDASGSLDYGNIDTFTLIDNCFELTGDFGIVTFTASKFSLDLDQA
jgi:hypothetical protein